MRRLQFIAFSLLLGIAPRLSLAGPPGLLVMDVQLVKVSESGDEADSLGYFPHWKLMNIETRDWYQHRSYAPFVQEVEPGIYCLYRLEPWSNYDFEYCKEPYFRVLPGKVNNAGLWVFGVKSGGPNATLLRSMTRLDAVLKRAAETNAALLQKFGAETRK